MALGLKLRDQTHPVRGPTMTIGRSSACELHIDDATLSRRHAVIHVEWEGGFIEDLGSRNGTAVNGEPVRGRRRIRPGDVITFGTVRVIVEEVSEELGLTAPMPAPPRHFPDTLRDASLEDESTSRSTVHALIATMLDVAASGRRLDEAAKQADRFLAEARRDPRALGRDPDVVRHVHRSLGALARTTGETRWATLSQELATLTGVAASDRT